MPNVKPGDLCIILGTVRTPVLNGRIVEVVREVFVGDTFKKTYGGLTELEILPSGKSWEVVSKEPLPWTLVSEGRVVLHETIPVADIRLFKIKDKDVDVETETIRELELEKV